MLNGSFMRTKRHFYVLCSWSAHKGSVRTLAATRKWTNKSRSLRKLRESTLTHITLVFCRLSFFIGAYSVYWSEPEAVVQDPCCVSFYTCAFKFILRHTVCDYAMVMQYVARDRKVNKRLNGPAEAGWEPITDRLGFRPTFVINGLWRSPCVV